jgi:uncharacterized protein (DUF302 family)
VHSLKTRGRILISIKVPIAPKTMDEAAADLIEGAKALGIKQIAHSPLHKEYEALGLSNIRRTDIFQFCDPKIANALISHDIHFAAHLPCRIALIEDQEGKGWFVMVNPKFFKEALNMPPELQKMATICPSLLKIIGASPAALPSNLPRLEIAQTVVKMQIAEDISLEEAVDSLKLRANDLNVKWVGHQVLTDEYKKIGLYNLNCTEILRWVRCSKNA